MDSFSDKTAFVTGGASGIGLAIGRALAARGARVVLADIDAEALETAVRGLPGEVEAIRLDVRDRENWAVARRRAESRFGPVSLLVNNAGVVAEVGKGLLDQRPESFDRTIEVNLTGMYNGVITFGPGMRERGEGHIVNTSSTQGVITSAGVAAYCASKFGVVAMSESLRDELAPSGVGVSVLCPGVVATRLAANSDKLSGVAPRDLPDFGMDPATVAEMTIQAILDNKLYIFTHGEYLEPVTQRYERIRAALAETPISPIYDPTMPVPGTPEFAALTYVGR
jgi:NAD(P)-dependent dehydrogenase (short-subunit alcohol dehydrogenase family)